MYAQSNCKELTITWNIIDYIIEYIYIYIYALLQMEMRR